MRNLLFHVLVAARGTAHVHRRERACSRAYSEVDRRADGLMPALGTEETRRSPGCKAFGASHAKHGREPAREVLSPGREIRREPIGEGVQERHALRHDVQPEPLAPRLEEALDKLAREESGEEGARGAGAGEPRARLDARLLAQRLENRAASARRVSGVALLTGEESEGVHWRQVGRNQRLEHV